MKVAYLVSQYPAASHTFIRREIFGLRARGLDIVTYSIRRPPLALLEIEEDRLCFEETTYILPPKLGNLIHVHAKSLVLNPSAYFECLGLALKHRVPGFRSVLWALFHFVEAIVLADEFLKVRIEHLHCHFANSGASVGLIAARFARLPYSLTLHGISETDYPAGVLLAEKITAANLVVCASYFIRAQAMRVVSADQWHKMIIVRCTIDSASLPKRAIELSKIFRIIAVGRLSREKGYIGLLRAIAEIRRYVDDIELTIVGEGPDLGIIENEIDRLGIYGHVNMRGRLSETATLQAIAESDALVLASFAEGLPVVLMEAVALGVPVVASNIAGIPELVTHDETGLLFTPTDWGSLASNVIELARNPAMRARLADAARINFTVKFDRDQNLDILLDRFVQLANAEKDSQSKGQ